MFKIIKRNYNFCKKYFRSNYMSFSTELQPKIKWTKPENLSLDEERKFYEAEFEKIYKSQEIKEKQIINNELSEKEKKEVELIFDRIMELKGNDKIYFQLYMNNSFKKNLGFDVLNLNVQNPDMTASSHTFWPPHNPNWFKMNFSASTGSSGGQASGKIMASGKSDNKDLPDSANAPVKEKAAFDVVLEKFDAAKKITLIKEVRAVFNLGLKDAKDLVEKAPVTLKGNMKKDEAEALKKKLEEFGGTITLK